MRHIFIVNPVSGKENAGVSLLPHIQAAAKACGIVAEIQQTEAPKHATQIARGIGESGEAARLYAVGGDGTLNEVLNGAYSFPMLEVASVPCGSGNDFVRTFGTPADFLDLEDLIRGSAILVDLMQVDGGICAAITSTGLDAEVAYNIPKYRRIPLLGGTMAYNVSIIERLLRPLGKTLDITIDGQSYHGKYLIAAVCNGKTYGGGYKAAPYASTNDGMLEVILVKKISRLLIANIIGNYKKGTHFAQDGTIIEKYHDIIWHHRGKEVTIRPAGKEEFILNVDGECGPAPRLSAKVMPAAARFVLPAKLAEIPRKT